MQKNMIVSRSFSELSQNHGWQKRRRKDGAMVTLSIVSENEERSELIRMYYSRSERREKVICVFYSIYGIWRMLILAKYERKTRIRK